MRILVEDAVRKLDERGVLQRQSGADQSERVIQHVRRLIGRDLPADLVAFYQARIAQIGDFTAVYPRWSAHAGWRTPDNDIIELLPANAIPLFNDGCGSRYGLDLTPAAAQPAVYFFDHADSFLTPSYAAGSSLGVFLLLLADKDRAIEQSWPTKWELAIDPDLEHCQRAPAIWDAG